MLTSGMAAAAPGRAASPWGPGLPAGLPLRVIDMLRRQVPDGVPDDIKRQVRQQFDPGG
jgi:hypothetical protein